LSVESYAILMIRFAYYWSVIRQYFLVVGQWLLVVRQGMSFPIWSRVSFLS